MHSERNNLNEKAAYRVGENICDQYIRLEVNIQSI